MPGSRNLFVAILLCAFLVCLAGSELGELASLVDDTSNDYVVQPSIDDHLAESGIVKPTPYTEPRQNAPRTGTWDSASSFPVRLVQAAVLDPLELSTILRT